MNGSTVAVATADDWYVLAANKLGTVVDPMVFRAGEIFMRGASGAAHGYPGEAKPLEGPQAWEFLDKNVLALGFFFDALILNACLPLFNYGDTFDSQLNFDERSFAAFNDADQPAIQPVNVQWDVYTPIKQRALEFLRERIKTPQADGGLLIVESAARSILDELSQSEFQWEIRLGDELEALLPSEDDRRLGRFALGGLIFGEYARLMGSEHWLQPKRAGLHVIASAGSGVPDRTDEAELFAWLGRKYDLPVLQAWQPTFLYHVLEQAGSIRDIPAVIKKLRGSGAVKDYRAWREQAIDEWKSKGALSQQSLLTVERLKQKLGATGTAAPAIADAGVALVNAIAQKSPQSAVEAAAKTAPLFGDLLNAIPGRRHIKLLATSAHAKGRYDRIERHVRSLWENA